MNKIIVFENQMYIASFDTFTEAQDFVNSQPDWDNYHIQRNGLIWR